MEDILLMVILMNIPDRHVAKDTGLFGLHSVHDLNLMAAIIACNRELGHLTFKPLLVECHILLLIALSQQEYFIALLINSSLIDLNMCKGVQQLNTGLILELITAFKVEVLCNKIDID